MPKRRRASSATSSGTETEDEDSRRPRRRHGRQRTRSASIRRTVRDLRKAADQLGRMKGTNSDRRRRNERRRDPSFSSNTSRRPSATLVEKPPMKKREITGDQQWARASRLHLEDDYQVKRTIVPIRRTYIVPLPVGTLWQTYCILIRPKSDTHVPGTHIID